MSAAIALDCVEEYVEHVAEHTLILKIQHHETALDLNREPAFNMPTIRVERQGSRWTYDRAKLQEWVGRSHLAGCVQHREA